MSKRDQWKIDVRIHASSRGQNGSDAGPESFELRVFLQAWGRSNIDGVQHGAFGRDSIKDFALRGCWHRRALSAIVCKMWLSLPKAKVFVNYSLHASLTFSSWRWHIWWCPLRFVRVAFPIETALLQLSAHPGESILGLSAKLCQNVANGRLMSGSIQAAEEKMAVMLGRKLRVFLQGLRQKQHRWGAAWGIRKRFNQRFCIERVLTRRRKALRATVCKMWLSLPKAKVFINYSLHASLTFSWRWRRSSQICSSCLPHRNCSCSFQHIQASQFFLWKLASAHFRLSVQDDRSKFARERSQALFWASQCATHVMLIEIVCLAC